LLTRHTYKFRRHVGKIRGLVHCLKNLERWSENYARLISEEHYTVSIQPKYAYVAEDLEFLSNVTLLRLTEEQSRLDF